MEQVTREVAGAGTFHSNFAAIQTEFDNRRQLQTFETFFETARKNTTGNRDFLRHAAQDLAARSTMLGRLGEVFVDSLNAGKASLDDWVNALGHPDKKNSSNPFNAAYLAVANDYHEALHYSNQIPYPEEPSQALTKAMARLYENVQGKFFAVEDYMDGLPESASWNGPGGKAYVTPDVAPSLGLTVDHSLLKSWINDFHLQAQNGQPVDDHGDTSTDGPLSVIAYGKVRTKSRLISELSDKVSKGLQQISSAMAAMGSGILAVDDVGRQKLVQLLEEGPDTWANHVLSAGNWSNSHVYPGLGNLLDDVGVPAVKRTEQLGDSISKWWNNRVAPSLREIINTGKTHAESLANDAEKNLLGTLGKDFGVGDPTAPQTDDAQSSGGG